jgi:hypothetical protein
MTMEYILHFINTRAWVGDSPAEIAMIGFLDESSNNPKRRIILTPFEAPHSMAVL